VDRFGGNSSGWWLKQELLKARHIYHSFIKAINSNKTHRIIFKPSTHKPSLPHNKWPAGDVGNAT
jgi:hypothetical protein